MSGRRWGRRLGAAAALLLLLAGLDRAFPPDLSRAEGGSVLVVDREGTLLRGFTTGRDAWRLPVSAEDVSPLYRRMLLAYEDRRFMYHPGVDPLALARAAGQMAAHGEVVSGASTLTMQVARLLEPRERTMPAKVIEMARAVQLELRHSKDEILELYLTLAPYGGNLQGVRAASWAWFGKEPRHLTPAQAALLVVLPQAPSRLRPDRYPERARAARDKVLRRMVETGVLSAEAAQEAMEEAVPTRRRPMPFVAPHLARALARDAEGTRRVVRSTLDAGLQRQAETVAAREQAGLSRHATLAILVVENESRAVRAYVGSGDFFDAARDGQVDMAMAVRSPGSALKPFIYGMGFDDRLIHPDTLVLDRPTRFGNYQPENFERVYMGEVTVRTALQHSLNVPAVAVLDGIGPARFVGRLRQAGARLALNTRDGRPGLPVALGGAGITLRDLVMLYTGLANGGRVAPLRARPETPRGRAVRLISPAAAWYVARILESAPLPREVVDRARTRGGHPIAYKTGTSYGFRDAWAVGYDSRHTVGVWVGRPDGTPSPGRFGRETAAPILFRIFSLLPPGAERALTERPGGVIDAVNAELPPNLRRYGRALERAERRLTEVETGDLAIAYPPDGTTLALEPQPDGAILMPLAAEGGRRPLRWLVNGRPVESNPTSRVAFWRPDSRGFVRVTVIDAEGNSVTSIARLE